MNERMHRRRFFTHTASGLGVAAAGGSLAWWASASAEPPLRKTPSGDVLETVPPGGSRRLP